MSEQDSRLRFPVSQRNSVDITFDKPPTVREIANAARALLAQVEILEEDAPDGEGSQ